MALADLIIKLAADTKEYDKALAGATRRLEKVGSDLTGLGTKLTAGLSLPLLGIAALAGKVAIDFDDAIDKIRVGTGATGTVLDGLSGSFKTVFGGVPQSMGEVSTTIADLNTRLGLTGKPLEDLSTQMLNLARITGSEVGPLIASTTRVFGDWGVATDDQSGALDFLFKVSQSTGIGVDSLSQKLVQFGAPLRQMGFDMETSAALLGKFEKEGVNAELVMGSLRIALTKMAKEGIADSGEALQVITQRIKDAGSAGQANAIALDVFGARAGPDMAAAIREGRFEVDELLTSLRNSPETIKTATKDTDGFVEQLGLLKNQASLALEPLGTALVGALSSLMTAAEPVIGVIASMATAFGDADPWVQGLVLGVGALVAAIGPALIVIGSMVSGVAAISGVIGGAAGLVVGLKIAAVAVAAIAAGWAAWKLGEWLSGFKPVRDAFDFLIESLGTLWEWIKKIPGMSSAIDGVGEAGDKAKKAFTDLKAKIGDTSKATEINTKKQTANKDALGATSAAVDKMLAGQKKHKEEIRKLDTQYITWLGKLRDLQDSFVKGKKDFADFETAVTSGDAGREIDALTAKVAATQAEALNLKNVAVPVFLNDLPAATREALKAGNEYKEALKQLGIDGKRDLGTIAAEAAKARDVVLGSDLATDFQKKTAVYVALQAQVDAARHAGVEVPKEQLAMLNKMKSELDTKLPEVKAPWEKFGTEVSTIFTNFTQNISKSLFDGDLSFGEKAKSMLKSLGEATTSMFIKPFTDGIAKLLSGAIADLLGGSGLGGILNGLKGIGGIFGGGGGAARVAGGAADVFGDMGGAARVAGGGIGSSLGGLAGAANPIAAVAGVGSLISGVVGNFQMAGMNKTLDLIEKATRFAESYLLNIIEQLQIGLGNVASIQEYVWGAGHTALADILTELQFGIQDRVREVSDILRSHMLPRLEEIRDRNQPSINITIQGNVIGNRQFVDDIANTVAAKVRTQIVSVA